MSRRTPTVVIKSSSKEAVVALLHNNTQCFLLLRLRLRLLQKEEAHDTGCRRMNARLHGRRQARAYHPAGVGVQGAGMVETWLMPTTSKWLSMDPLESCSRLPLIGRVWSTASVAALKAAPSAGSDSVHSISLQKDQMMIAGWLRSRCTMSVMSPTWNLP